MRFDKSKKQNACVFCESGTVLLAENRASLLGVAAFWGLNAHVIHL